MSGRASIVGAAVTHVGRVRDHNEDAHFFDGENGVFLVCDGMGGHAAGEVASAIAIKTIRQTWDDDATHAAIDGFLAVGTPDAKKQLLAVLRQGVVAAHDAIVAEANRDSSKAGMGTTLVGAIVVGGDVIFAHAGDSRAYLVRDNIAMQLTEDHTLLARLLAAGIDVDLTGEGARFKSMLTNALGIGADCRVSTFVVPLADGDRFLLCSDGISEYVKEVEIGEVLAKAASPSRAAQKLVDLALDRGGGDNATALVVRVLEAGESPLPVDRRRRDDDVIAACALWGLRVNPQQRLRALRIAIPRDHAPGDKLPALTLGDRVAWIILEGEVMQDGKLGGPASLVYPEALIVQATLPDKDGLAVAQTEVRALAIRADDFKEICDEDPELGEALLEALVNVISRRPARAPSRTAAAAAERQSRAKTDPGETTAILDASAGPAPEGPAPDVRPSQPDLPEPPDPIAFGRVATTPLDGGKLPRSLPLSPDEPVAAPVVGTPSSPRAIRAMTEDETTLTRDKVTRNDRPSLRGDNGAALRALWGGGSGDDTGERTIEKVAALAPSTDEPSVDKLPAVRLSEPEMPTVIITMEDPTPRPGEPPTPPAVEATPATARTGTTEIAEVPLEGAKPAPEEPRARVAHAPTMPPPVVTVPPVEPPAAPKPAPGVPLARVSPPPVPKKPIPSIVRPAIAIPKVTKPATEPDKK